MFGFWVMSFPFILIIYCNNPLVRFFFYSPYYSQQKNFTWVSINTTNRHTNYQMLHEPKPECLLHLIEEAEAINWYEQRISVEKDDDAKAIMKNAQQEEFKHFGMDLEFLLRRMPKWRVTLEAILFKSGDIVELGEKGEEKAE